MGRRLLLQALLEDILGSRNVYFQAPNNLAIQYPCIVYERDYEDVDYANNALYRHMDRYLVTVIDRDPDSEIPGKVRAQPLCRFSRHFVSDNLHHDAFNLYF